MTIAEQISNEVLHLPPDRQQEVLDFVEFLRQQVTVGRSPRPHGLSQGEFTVLDDFDAPVLQEIAATNGWPTGFFTEVIGAWKGEPLVREYEGDYEQRDELR